MPSTQRKAKACKVCQEVFQPWSNMSPLNRFCSPFCAAKWAGMKRDEKRLKAQKKEIAERKETLKTLSQLCSKAQEAVNSYIMARDRAAGYGCISCGSNEITEAGHYFHAGSKYRCSRLRFDHRNINGQCNSCNQHKGGGNQHEYRLGFIQRYGQEEFDALCETKRLADCGELESISKDQAREIAKEHRKMASDLKRGH